MQALVIHEILDRIEAIEMGTQQYKAMNAENSMAPYERLSKSEVEEFTTSYLHGKLLVELFLKASGLIDPILLTQVPGAEPVLTWLSNRNIISSEIVNMLKGLDRYIKDLNWESRQGKQLPGLPELLLKSNYLTPDTIEWLVHEFELNNINWLADPDDGNLSSARKLLINNFITSEKTIHNASLILRILKSLLYDKRI